jgi:CheY-like chemotaxis protein
MNTLITPLSLENREPASQPEPMIIPPQPVTVSPNLSQPNKPVAVSLDVVWQGSFGKQDARMSEISMEGCFIDSTVQGRALGDLVEFKVHLPSGPWVSLKGELVNENYPMGFGLRFTDLSDGDLRLLAQVVVAHGGESQLAVERTEGCRTQMAQALVAEINRSAWNTGQIRGRILIADDNALTLAMVAAIAESEGYEPVSAEDGRQALKLLQQDTVFSAAILDMTMPHLKGLDLILFMKADKRLQRIPVGLITAEKDPKIWSDSVAAGACVFLPKPFMPPQVQMMLRMLASQAGHVG